MGFVLMSQSLWLCNGHCVGISGFSAHNWHYVGISGLSACNWYCVGVFGGSVGLVIGGALVFGMFPTYFSTFSQ
jgi:hypothetical protein